jgi:hypothetical protein
MKYQNILEQLSLSLHPFNKTHPLTLVTQKHIGIQTYECIIKPAQNAKIGQSKNISAYLFAPLIKSTPP